MKVERRGEQWCVEGPDGEPVEGKLFATEDEARAHLDACKAKRRDGAEVRRFDVLERLDGPQLMPNGWLKADAWISRTGIQEYRLSDGSVRRELRVPDEVFDGDALASFSMMPVTDEHPPELLNAQNASRYQRGHLGETVEPDGERVRAKVLITDGDLVSKVLGGKSQLSCGYTCELDATPGEWKGQKYDAKQTHIRGNHVAVVTRGRAGPDVRLRLDSGDAVSIRADREQGGDADPQKENTQMAIKMTVDGIEVEVANEQAAQLIQRSMDERKAKADALSAELKALKKEKEEEEEKAKADAAALRARADVAEGKVRELEKARTDAQANVPALVKARVALESKAREVLGADAKFDDKSDREVKAAVIAKLSPDVKLDGEPDAYVDAAYKGVLAVASSEALARVRAAGTLDPKKASSVVVDAEAARRKAREDAEIEWQKPLSAQKA